MFLVMHLLEVIVREERCVGSATVRTFPFHFPSKYDICIVYDILNAVLQMTQGAILLEWFKAINMAIGMVIDMATDMQRRSHLCTPIV